MKKLLLSFIIIVLFSPLAWAGSSITFAWDPNSEEDLAGYNLYQTTSQGNYLFEKKYVAATIPAGTETVTIQDVLEGEWWWVLTAFDTKGNESERSNEVGMVLDTAPPAIPGMLNIRIMMNGSISKED